MDYQKQNNQIKNTQLCSFLLCNLTLAHQLLYFQINQPFIQTLMRLLQRDGMLLHCQKSGTNDCESYINGLTIAQLGYKSKNKYLIAPAVKHLS